MRTRANFGVIGNTRTITANSIGGMFSIDDQRVAKQSSLWAIFVPPVPIPVDPVALYYLVIAGGGGGGGATRGGGGGAGGYRSNMPGESSGGGASAESPFELYSGLSYTVTVDKAAIIKSTAAAVVIQVATGLITESFRSI